MYGVFWLQGMDVIEYYAVYGHNAKIKLFHAIRADSSGTGCPYELMIVPKEHISGNYFTISASGVVQMFGDNSPAEFTPIGDWVREHSVYNMMKQLRFFKTYMAQRMFRKWRAAARSQHFEKVKKKLESRLFLAKPEFCFAIMDAHVSQAASGAQQCGIKWAAHSANDGDT